MLVLFGALVTGACGGTAEPSGRATGVDHWQVWICRVPPDSNAPAYANSPLRDQRVEVDAVVLAEHFGAHLGPWFAQVSYGQYGLEFSPGGEVVLDASDGPEACLERALDRSGHDLGSGGRRSTINAVLAVADAVHPITERGGFGRVGRNCGRTACAAAVSRRGAYVGGADFLPAWGDWPGLDLVAHEIGHALGWGHSGLGSGGEYLSAIDLMSDSAGLRALNPEWRHGPPPLALHRRQAGWLMDRDVVVVDGGGRGVDERVHLYPVAVASGSRLLELRAGADRLYVEVIDDPLMDPVAPGVTVHRLTTQSIDALVGPPPHTDLMTPGDTWSGGGWTLIVGGPPPDQPTGPWEIRVRRDR